MERDEDHVTALVLNLKPWTQYAVYVQTYTTSSAKYGAISNIVYFTTLPYCTSTHESPPLQKSEGGGDFYDAPMLFNWLMFETLEFNYIEYY